MVQSDGEFLNIWVGDRQRETLRRQPQVTSRQGDGVHEGRLINDNWSGRRIASNQMLLIFGRTTPPGGSSHEIRDSRSAPLARPAATHRRTRCGHSSAGVLRLTDTLSDSPNIHYVNPSTRGSPRMPKERRARSLTVSAVSLTFKVDTARRQRMLRTESAQDGRTKIARAQPRIRDGERTSSTLTDATSPSPTPSATRARPAPNMLEAAA